MTKCYPNSLNFPSVKRRKIELDFDGGEITSDGGTILLRETDRRIGLTQAINKVLKDSRCKARCAHSQLSLLRQRIYGLAAGYEDLNDHTTLRSDTAFQTSIEADKVLGSASTLCRLEQRANQATMFKMHEVLIDKFIASYKKAPSKLVLDFDATDDPVHGDQVGKYFSGYYDHYCFLPLYVFCEKQLLVSYLRPASRGGAFNSAAVLKLLVRRLRTAWPKVKIIFRGDSAYSTPLIMGWCDRNKVDYVIGIAKNSRLLKSSEYLRATAEACYNLEKSKQVLFADFDYAAGSWKNSKRRIIVKAEHSEKGSNPRFIVTTLDQTPDYVYKTLYCARGEMENRIKEQQFLFSDRTSCHEWWPNQFRLLLSGMAYTLLETMRRIALVGTELANAQVDTIRLKLIKVGGIVLRNTRKVKLMLSSTYPYKNLFAQTVINLNSA